MYNTFEMDPGRDVPGIVHNGMHLNKSERISLFVNTTIQCFT